VPTYGYHCPRCETEFEVFQRMTDEPGADCPSCGSRGRRLYYPAGIVFKGSGFYKTDSRKGSGAAGTATTPAGGGAATKPASDGGDKAAGSGDGGTATTGTAGTASGAAAPATPGTQGP
jgi:putative FmdB family regulatory protein